MTAFLVISTFRSGALKPEIGTLMAAPPVLRPPTADKTKVGTAYVVSFGWYSAQMAFAGFSSPRFILCCPPNVSTSHIIVVSLEYVPPITSICALLTTLQVIMLFGYGPETLLFGGYGPLIHWKLGIVRV